MGSLTITRGLPGSGKTTFARAWVASSPTTRARVNRDDLRAMCHDGTFVQQRAETVGTERAIIAARDAAITALLGRGLDVINDDTNLPQRVARDLRRLAERAGVSFSVVDLTDVSVDECIRRDAARARVVGEAVIRDHWQRFVRNQPHPLPLADELTSPLSAPLVPYVVPKGGLPVVIVDIDGTVALAGARSPFDETRVHEDRPNHPVVSTVRALHASGLGVVFMSGRTDGCREATERWLREHVAVPYLALHMRAAGDMRKDAIVKAELFDAHVRHAYRVALVLDDRQQVVDMWRSLGLTVFQVAEGKF